MAPPERLSPFSIARKTDDWFKRATAALLGQVPCRAGCCHCCIGPFPITFLDVQLMHEGLSRLPGEQRKAIESRAKEQTEAMEAAFPRLATSRSLDQWQDSEIDRVIDDFGRYPCPALTENGLCMIYENRPLTCRSMGIPIDQGGATCGACEVQTFVPIVRLSATQRAEEDRLSQQEGHALSHSISSMEGQGEEILLPYGFLPGKNRFNQTPCHAAAGPSGQ